MTSTPRESSETLVGQILDARFAVLEHLALDRYEVFDLHELRRRVLQLGQDGTVLPSEPARVPRTERAETRFEAAWFAIGERIAEAWSETIDYVAYQAELELLARQAA